MRKRRKCSCQVDILSLSCHCISESSAYKKNRNGVYPKTKIQFLFSLILFVELHLTSWKSLMKRRKCSCQADTLSFNNAFKSRSLQSHQKSPFNHFLHVTNLQQRTLHCKCLVKIYRNIFKLKNMLLSSILYLLFFLSLYILHSFSLILNFSIILI